ncbi:MAG: hypothetical protein AB1768_16525 [Pseudomonadota bacterium]|jgi:hypothetical protein
METVAGFKPPKSRLAILDLVAYVVLAACIGLATSITLGGVVILLAQGADAATSREVRMPPDATRAAAERATLPGVSEDREAR